MQTTETMAHRPLTEAELDYLRAGLATELPHLSCTVELVDGTLYVKGVKA